MLKINQDKKQFSKLQERQLADVSISERYDLQEYIYNSPDAFFAEIGQKLFLVGKEVKPSDTVLDRIDLLALDQEGTAVVIELKRGKHKLHLLQAIAYAGMIAYWESDDFLELINDEKSEKLLDFLEVDKDDINRQQKIILIAEAYDYEVLVAAEWLSDQYGVDIACCRISLAEDSESKAEYFVCSNVFPLPELAHQALARGGTGKRKGKRVKWTDWETALAAVDNKAMASYFGQELDAERESHLRRRILHYRLDGHRRWFLTARKDRAYVWQNGRFADDVDFWSKGLSQPSDVGPVKDETCLRFILSTADDFKFFHDAATGKLKSVEWIEGSGEEEEDVDAEG